MAGITIFTIHCVKKSPNSIENNPVISSKISKVISQVNSLSVPETVPDDIDSLALVHAGSLNCDGIRILTTNSEKGDISYFISFFTDEEGIKEEAFYSLGNQVKKLNEEEKTYLNNLLEPEALSKTNAACDHCWNLAYFFENANYDSVNGAFFRFSQQAHNTGYFHKIINRLGSPANCCRANFPGGLNNLVSSHLWANETKCGKRTVVDYIHVWDETYRNGLIHYNFTGTKAYHDNNYSDEECWLPPMYPLYI